MAEHFTFKSYSWSLGTTSFRTADFHRKVEEQLILLDEFWKIPKNEDRKWKSNSETQVLYYDFIYDKGFVTGDIQDSSDKKAKTARQKTSGLVDIGLLNENRRLTEVGNKLLKMSLSGDFSCDNDFQIPSDSFLYLKQMIKTTNETDDWIVRPYLVTGKVLTSCDGYLSDEEFTFLLPLCTNKETTDLIISKIHDLRAKKESLDQIIVDSVLKRYNYRDALLFFVNSKKTPDDIMAIGMNRDGARHDKCYVKLYEKLKSVYLYRDESAIPLLFASTKDIKNKPGTLWRKLLFLNSRNCETVSDLAYNDFCEIHSEIEFDRCFFKYLHLIKIKATLLDYKDLNRRYLQITDSVVFEDGIVKFTPLFDNYFKTEAKNVFDDAFSKCLYLAEDCDLQTINKHLIFSKKNIVEVFNNSVKETVNSIEEVYDYIENDRYNRFRRLIDKQFPNTVILSMLDLFETRSNDSELIRIAGGEADVPTIFEYIVGVAWYRISGYSGKILDYMKLSLDMNLLPRTHAGGGESDIVYKYSETPFYPEHTLLIECTLLEGTGQRHGEMEPVSRHLANYMIDEDKNTYCTFVSNNLHPSIISDFRMRKGSLYYRSENEYVNGMKIIPLHTRDLKNIIKKGLLYNQLYKTFEEAFSSDDVEAPPEWYKTYVNDAIESM